MRPVAAGLLLNRFGVGMAGNGWLASVRMASYRTTILQIRLTSFRFTIAPSKQTRVHNFAAHVGHKGGAKRGLMTIILRQVRIDVIRQYKPLHKLRRMNRAIWWYDLRDMQRLTALRTSAKAPYDASVVHQGIETRFAHVPTLTRPAMVSKGVVNRTSAAGSAPPPWNGSKWVDFGKAGIERESQQATVALR